MLEQTLILIKPDGLKKSLTGNVLTKLSEAKLAIVGAKVVRVTREHVEKHYEHLKDKAFFNELIDFFLGNMHGTGGRIVAFVYQGEDAIRRCRTIAGATNPEEADPTSIRGAYGRITTRGVYENVIHTSEDSTTAEREIKLWFKPDEIFGDIYPSEKVILKEVETRIWK